MTWSERLKSTFNIFKKITLPLYIFYLIYLVLFGIIMIIFSLLPPVESFMQSLDYLEYDNLFLEDDFLKDLPLFAVFFAFLAVIGLIMTSLLYTGIYHLTVKGFTSQAYSRDFKLTDAKKMIGWNSIVLLLFLATISVGILVFAFLGVFNDTVSHAFAIIFPICMLLVSIFMIPWILSGGYYILAYRDLSFGKAFVYSWRFFRQNMGTLWAAVLIMFLINIFIVLIQDVSSTIGGLVSFIATPFFSLIPIVWTLTLIREQTLAPEPPEVIVNEPSNDYYSLVNNTSSYDNSPSLDDIPSYKPRKEDSPPGYYHTSDRSAKNIDAEINFCPTCGTKVRSNAVYCGKCAFKLK